MAKCKFVVYIVVLLAYLNVSAQHLHDDEKCDTLAHHHLSEVNVQGVLPGNLHIPVQTIGTHVLQSHGVMTPADALHHVSGVSLTRDGTWATSINIRGFSEAKLLFMVDGDRMQTATDLAGTLSTVDIGSLEGIEIVKGAASVLFGNGALGGVINFISKRPAYSEHFDSNGSFSTGFNTVNQLWHNNLNVNFTNHDWYLAVDGSYRTAQNTMTPAGKINNSQFNDASWGIRGGMKNNDNQELLVNYNQFEAWDVGLPGGSVFVENAMVQYLGFKRKQLSGEYIFTELSPMVKDVRIKAYTQNISREVENIANPSTAIFPSSLTITSGVKATADLYFNDYHTMTVGVEGWQLNHQSKQMLISTSTSDTLYIGEQPTPNAKMLDVGVFAHYKWVLDPKFWKVNTGVRLDFIRTVNDTSYQEVFKYKYVNGVKTELPMNHAVLFAEGQKTEPAYALHMDIVFTPDKQNEFVFSVANAYRVASIEERFQYIDQGGSIRVGNPNLKSEKGFFANLNYSYKGRSIKVKADFFANYLFDLITEVRGNILHQLSGEQQNSLSFALPPFWKFTNIDKALYLGGEVELKWLIIPNLEVITHASYVYAKDVTTNEHLELIPPLHGIAALHYHFHEALGSFAEMDWEYELEGEHGPGEEPHRHAIFHAGLHTTPRKISGATVQLIGGVHNIMNKAYEEHLSSLRGLNRLEPGRNFFLKAKIQW